MKLMEFTKCATTMYKTRGNRRPKSVHLIGPPGVGKTDVVKKDLIEALSAEYQEEFGYADVLLPTIDAPDLRGFLVPTKDDKGRATSFFTRSAVLPSVDYLAKHPRGIMFLDERNAADLLTQKATAPAVLDGRFGEDYLPIGWWVISASNRMEDRAGVIRPPTHLVNRERTIQIAPDVTSWAVWAERNDVHPMMIAFAKQMPGVVFSESVPKGEGAFCTPRSFTAAAELVAEAAGVDASGNPDMAIPVNSLLMQMVGGDIGDGATAQLFGFLKVGDQLPTIEEVLKDPQKAKCPKDLSAAYAALQLLIHHASPSNIEILWEYAERFPKELQASAATSLVEKGKGAMLTSKRLGKWVMENRALIVATNSNR